MFTDADVPGVWVTEIGWTEPVVAGVESEVSWTVGGVTDVVMDIGTVVGSSVTASVGTEKMENKIIACFFFWETSEGAM